MSGTIASLEPIGSFSSNSVDIPEFGNALSSIFGAGILDDVYIGEAGYSNEDNVISLCAYIGLRANTPVGIPGVSILNIRLGRPGQEWIVARCSFFVVNLNNPGQWRFAIEGVPWTVTFDDRVLRQVTTAGAPRKGTEVLFSSDFFIDSNYRVVFSPVDIALPRSFIGGTNFIISAERVRFSLDAANPQVMLSNLKFEPPVSLFGTDLALPDLEISEAVINKMGFTGSVLAEWSLRYENGNYVTLVDNPDGTVGTIGSSIFGLPGGIEHFRLDFEESLPVSADIQGRLRIPYFDSDVEVNAALNPDYSFTILLKSGGFKLTREEIVSVDVTSLSVSSDSESISVSGFLQPLLYSSEGMKWPRMDVENLRIDSTGKFSIDEAWLDLKDMATLDLFGFHLELRKIGLGTEGTDKMWIDLSGGLKLVDQIPIGVDVEGFRLLWPMTGELEEIASQIEVRFKGVQFSFGVPNALKIDGLIRFFKDPQAVGFAGDMILVIPPAGITAEAGLLIGMNTEPDPYPFFYVYFGLECTAGIPLGQSGLALKGALGLFGINVTPDKTPEQNWYYDWYKRAPAPGAHQTTKWTYQRDSLAIGAGLTITTADGVIKGTKGIVVLAIPGPILVINGKALILDGLNPGEPPFSAVAVFDGREKIVQFNIEAQAELVKDVVDAHAGVEAFFDFKDITNWHLYLGQDTPADRRVRANVLDVLEADAYLMLDMVDADSLRTRMGVSVNVRPKIPEFCFDLDIPFVEDPCIRFKAHLDIDGAGVVSVQPEQFSGSADIDAGIEVDALGFKLDIGAGTHLSVEGPSPFSLDADLRLHADLPDPLPDYRDHFPYKLTIPNVDLNITNPLTTISLFSRFTPQSVSIEPAPSTLSDDDLKHTPTVNCDVNPILAFEHEMNQNCDFEAHPEAMNETCHFIRYPGGIKTYDVGPITFTPAVTSILIEERRKSDPSRTWTKIYGTSDNLDLVGAWLAESDPGSPEQPASRRLQLLTTNPLINTTHYSGNEGKVMNQFAVETTHLSRMILDDYPDLLCGTPEPEKKCLDFKYEKALETSELRWARLVFRHDSGITVANGCLASLSGLQVTFPESVLEVTIEFCNNPAKLEIFTSARRGEEERIKCLGEKGGNAQRCGCGRSVQNTAVTSGKVVTVSAVLPFDCLTITASNKDGIKLHSICYQIERSRRNNRINAEICASNKGLIAGGSSSGVGNLILANKLFNPGCYYRITVTSAVKGEVGYIEGMNDALHDLYVATLGPLSRSFPTYSYFQTESVPENISAYIKWSLPFHQATNIRVKDPLFVRFTRDYLRAFYDNADLQDSRLRAFIKTSEGSLVPCDLSWDQPQSSSTQFPDEQYWNEHLRNNGVAPASLHDSQVRITPAVTRAALYQPNRRYQLILGIKAVDVHSDAELVTRNRQAKEQLQGNAIVRPVIRYDPEPQPGSPSEFYKILHSIDFTTSKYASLAEMVFGEGRTSAKAGKAQIVKGGQPTFPTSFSADVNAWINREEELHKTLVDYQFNMAQYQGSGELLVGKEAVEKRKLLLREAKDKIDESFRSVAMALSSDTLFKQIPIKAEITAFYTNTGPVREVEYLWLRLPEAIDVKKTHSTAGGGRYFGNINVQLFRKSPTTPPPTPTPTPNTSVLATMIFNADTSQVIFKLKNKIRVQGSPVEYGIAFSRLNDHGDDTRPKIFGDIVENSHHRYDRPSIKGMGPEVANLPFSI